MRVVPLRRIELPTPSLPMTCSTTELQRHMVKWAETAIRHRQWQGFFTPAAAFVIKGAIG